MKRSTEMSNALRDQLPVLHHGLELLRHGQLCAIVRRGSTRNNHVDLVGLGRDDLYVERLFGQEHLASGRLVDGDAGHLAGDLDLTTAAIHHFDGRDGVIEHHPRLVATVESDVVHFALDLHHAAIAFVYVNRLLRLRVFDRQHLVVGLVFDDPFIALQGKLGRLGLRFAFFLRELRWFFCWELAGTTAAAFKAGFLYVFISSVTFRRPSVLPLPCLSFTLLMSANSAACPPPEGGGPDVLTSGGGPGGGGGGPPEELDAEELDLPAKPEASADPPQVIPVV